MWGDLTIKIWGVSNASRFPRPLTDATAVGWPSQCESELLSEPQSQSPQGIPNEFMIPIAWGIGLCGGLPAVSTGWNCLEGPARFPVEVSTLWKVCPRKNHLLATFVQTKPGVNGGHLKLGDPLWPYEGEFPGINITLHHSRAYFRQGRVCRSVAAEQSSASGLLMRNLQDFKASKCQGNSPTRSKETPLPQVKFSQVLRQSSS